MVANARQLTPAQLSKQLGASLGTTTSLMRKAAVTQPSDLLNTWVLSSKTGLGAVKAALDDINVVIRQHVFARAQYLTVEGPTGRKQFVQMYYRGQQSSRLSCQIEFRGFLKEDAPKYYLIVCFQDNTFWAISRKELIQRWNDLKEDPIFHTDDGGFVIPIHFREHASGILATSFMVENSPYLLTSSKQLGV